MRTFVRGVDEVSAVIFVPLVFAEPLFGTIAIPCRKVDQGLEIGGEIGGH